MTHKILAIHDLSGYGNTSLMAIIPLMYHFGIEVCALPSMLLSANTCFDGYQTLDTSSFMRQSLEHFKQLNMRFSAIYSGFLGNPEQVQTVLEAIDGFSDTPLVMIDPVMADDGLLYSCYPNSMISAMRELVKKADIITPNFTEACFLANLPAPDNPDGGFSDELCRRLLALGPKELIITSYPGKENLKSILYLSQTMPEPVHFPYTHIPCFYTGAGDILSALILIYTLKGHERMNAIPKAAEFIQMAISHALARNRDGSAGVLLQELIHDLQI